MLGLEPDPCGCRTLASLAQCQWRRGENLLVRDELMIQKVKAVTELGHECCLRPLKERSFSASFPVFKSEIISRFRPGPNFTSSPKVEGTLRHH